MLFSGQNHPNKKDIIYLVDLNKKKKHYCQTKTVGNNNKYVLKKTYCPKKMEQENLWEPLM